MNKKLIAYFSVSGVTKEVATKVAEIVGGDLFEIKAKVPYTEEDLNWMNKQSRSSIEMNDKSSRPEVENKVNNMNEYDTIYLGFPIWWGVAPTIVNTFLESYDLSNKKIITFATSGGSGIGNSTNELKVSAPNATFINGKVINMGNVADFVNDMERG